VREDFYQRYLTRGSNAAKRKAFKCKMDRAQKDRLIGVGDIDAVTYVWRTESEAEDREGEWPQVRGLTDPGAVATSWVAGITPPLRAPPRPFP
jgi:hypothetical protein